MFIYLTFLKAAITIHYPTNTENLTIQEYVIENQICSGFFIANSHNIDTYEAMIVSLNEKITHIKITVLNDIKTHFSLNTTNAETFKVKITKTSNIKSTENMTDKIVYNFEIDFDTFNINMAKNVRVIPALNALNELEEMTSVVYVQIRASRNDLQTLTRQHSMMIKYVVLTSVITLMLLIIFNMYQIYALKRFFKSKKLI